MKPMHSVAALAVAIFAAASAVATHAVVRNGTMVYEQARRAVRCVFFGTNSVAGSYSIDYGAPEWKAEYDAEFDARTLGKRMRFGKDHWTTLDTSCPLSIGGKDVKPGIWYCVLERSKKGDFSLVLLDSAEITKSRMDPFASEQTKGGVLIPLEHAKDQAASAALAIDVVKDDANEKEQTLTIAWGPHKLTAKVKAKV